MIEDNNNKGPRGFEMRLEAESIHIDDGYAEDLLAKLVNIPSVFPREEKLLLFLENELGTLGFELHRYPVSDGRWNVLARMGGGSPVLCLNAHADTMPENGASVPLAKVEAGRMRGLGSADDKASIACIVTAAKSIMEAGVRLKGTLDLLISVDEEADALGVRAAVDQGYRCDFAITGEPTGLEIVPVHCGLIFLEVVVRGKSAHGAIPWAGENAIERMMELVAGLRVAVTDYPAHPLAGPPSLSIGRMQAGDRPNRVPDLCEASLDIRLTAPLKTDDILAKIDRFFAPWKGTAEYRILKLGGTLDTPLDSRLVSTLSASVAAVTGRTPVHSSLRGWTEAEVFRSRLGIDAVVFGPGSMKQAHTADEFVSLDEVRKCTRIYAGTAMALLGT